MKQLSLLTVFVLISVLAAAQCVPQTDFGDEPFGLAPDTLENLAAGEVGVLYTQQIDVKVPADGGFVDLPFITVDSASIVTLAGLPPGLSIDCAENAFNECTYLGGTIGCAVISGIPESGGTYDLDIELLVYNSLAPVPLSFEGYTIEIDGPVGLEDREAVKGFKVGPNPVNDQVKFYLNAHKGGNGTIRIYDLLGKEVHAQNIQVATGQNQFTYQTATLPEGVYICHLEVFGESQTRRMVVVH